MENFDLSNFAKTITEDFGGSEVCGMFINPHNENQWSNKPYNKEQRLASSIYDHIRNEGHGLHKEMQLIAQKKSKLSKSQRDECIKLFKYHYGN